MEASPRYLFQEHDWNGSRKPKAVGASWPDRKQYRSADRCPVRVAAGDGATTHSRVVVLCWCRPVGVGPPLNFVKSGFMGAVVIAKEGKSGEPGGAA